MEHNDHGNARPKEAVVLFHQMLGSGAEPDKYTFSSVLADCGRTGTLSHGEWLHCLMKEKEIVLNPILNAALIDMYSKCGSISAAKQVFDSVSRDDVSVWNAMITGLAMHVHANSVFEAFSHLENDFVLPDSITFIGILTACSHCGLVEAGCKFFNLMKSKYSFEPQLEHYGAMVDLLGRAGLVEEAYNMINTMPVKPDLVIWRALLSASRIHKMPELAEIAIEKMTHLQSGD